MKNLNMEDVKASKEGKSFWKLEKRLKPSWTWSERILGIGLKMLKPFVESYWELLLNIYSESGEPWMIEISKVKSIEPC